MCVCIYFAWFVRDIELSRYCTCLAAAIVWFFSTGLPQCEVKAWLNVITIRPRPLHQVHSWAYSDTQNNEKWSKLSYYISQSEGYSCYVFFVCHITCKAKQFFVLSTEKCNKCEEARVYRKEDSLQCGSWGCRVVPYRTGSLYSIVWCGIYYCQLCSSSVSCMYCTLRNERSVHHVTVIRDSGPYTSFILPWY